MSNNYSSDDYLSEDELASLKWRLNRARSIQLGQPIEPVQRPPTPEELTERGYCDDLSRKLLNHELDASQFWNLRSA
jgi:hypothetical protein